ncbi:MAG TPA: amino acid-binding protein [Methylomusa anaerophila]|uniref:Acetolactate synthase 3 regulatory subunit n=1 Tax=Methylomusa anaerophila TaxID=1930071 RepID=A0A348AIF7_9FIRM|nr:hypothetical protein [Methylomusa anaerophila]BBB90855.1 acetolactate synthase 3 regulatory subunit [Methylomusa anaerophila]HML90649.1 amino acid-binding protein [Methylomusa anaerophila]
MIIQQMSVFVENQPGKMAEVLGTLKSNGVNIRALALADTADFGILRIIVNEPERVRNILRESGFTVRLTPVLTMIVSDNPGGLYELINLLSNAGVSIEYMYAFAAYGSQDARVVLKVDNLVLAERLISGEDKQDPAVVERDGTVPGYYW